MTDSNYKGFRYGVLECVCNAATPLLEFVAAEISQHSPTHAPLTLIELGAIYVNDQRALNPAQALKLGDRVRIHSSPRRFTIPLDLAERIEQEAETYFVIDKPAGLPTEPTVDNVKENLLWALEDMRGQHLFLVHNLEAESSGLVVIAKTQTKQTEIKRAFNDGKITRIISAYTSSPVASETLAPGIHVEECMARFGRTDVITEGRMSWTIQNGALQTMYRLTIELSYGRPSNVREALANRAAPILGDKTSGSQTILLSNETQKHDLAMRVIAYKI